jgi:hypothetical protein
MSIAVGSQAVVSEPAIRVDCGSRFDRFLYKRHETVRRRIRHATHSNPPETAASNLFHGHRNQNLFIGLSATNSSFRSTPVGLVDLNATCETIASGTNHCSPQFVKPRPCGLVAAKPQNLLQPKSAGTCLLACHPPHGSKPNHQGRARVLKDRSGRHGGLPATPSAFIQNGSDLPPVWITTFGTPESSGPTQLDQILAAGIFGCESCFEFCQGPRKIIHAPVHYILGLPESRG